MVAHQQKMQIPDKQNSKLKRISIEELRTNPFNVDRTDEELEKQADTLLELSLILYGLYMQSREDSNTHFQEGSIAV
jgi:hypothetical protein